MSVWDDLENFSESEFTCSHSGETKMDDDFLYRLQDLRTKCGFGFRITSGYRSPEHPIEAPKAELGKLSPHTTGRAADILIRGSQAYTLLKHATDMGFTGIGVSQTGNTRFIHLDTLTETDGFPRPWIWSY